MPNTLRIGCQIGAFDPFWIQVREAVYQRIQELKVNLVPIEITTDPLSLTLDERAALVDEFLAENVGALISWNMPEDMIKRCLDSGLPIIFMSEIFTVKHPLFSSPKGLDQAARIAGEYIALKLNGHGKFLCLGGVTDPNDPDSSRVIGVSDILKKHPDISFLHKPSPWSYNDALTNIKTTMREFDKPFDAIFGLSDSLALAVRDGGRELGFVDDHTIIVGLNGDPLALAAIAKGSMSATVETSALAYGIQLVELACQAARGEALPDHFGYKLRLITTQNVAEVALEKLITIANIPSRLVGVNIYLERNRLTQLETSAAINRRVGSLLDRQELSREIADLIRANYEYDRVQLFLWSEQEQLLVLDEPIPFSGEQVSLPLEKSGLLAEALSQNEIISIPDTSNSKRFPPDPRVTDVYSRVILPIRFGDKILGLLDLHSRHPKIQQRQELIGLQSLADQLGIAMRNAELYSEAVQARATAETAYQTLSENQQQLLLSERMASLGRLTAGIAHEMNTPLAATRGALSEMNELIDEYENSIDDAKVTTSDHREIAREMRNSLRLADKAATRAAGFVSGIKAQTRDTGIQEGQHFDAAEIIQEALLLLEHSAIKKGCQVIFETPIDSIELYGMPGRLAQVVTNLVTNSIDASKNNSSIILKLIRQTQGVDLTVEDKGCGISLENLNKIFDPMFTTKPFGEGTGLGMTIVHNIVAGDFGGTIEVSSKVDEGTTFTVHFPTKQ